MKSIVVLILLTMSSTALIAKDTAQTDIEQTQSEQIDKNNTQPNIEQDEHKLTADDSIKSSVTQLSNDKAEPIGANTKKQAHKRSYTTYLIIGGIIAIVGFAVYRKKYKFEYKIVQTDVLSLDDIITYAKKYASRGYSNMRIWRLSAMDDTQQFAIKTTLTNRGISNVDAQTTLISCLEKNGELKPFVIYLAQNLDAKILAVVNTENIIKINFR